MVVTRVVWWYYPLGSLVFLGMHKKATIRICVVGTVLGSDVTVLVSAVTLPGTYRKTDSYRFLCREYEKLVNPY